MRAMLTLSLLLTITPRTVFGQAAAADIDLARVRADITLLSSDAMEGRLSLKPGADRAAEFIAAEFRKIGLKPIDGNSYSQKFPLVAYRTDASATSLTVRSGGRAEMFRANADVRGGFSRDVTASGQVVFAGYGVTAPEYDYDDYREVDARGKVVLVFDHEPQEADERSVFNGAGHSRHANQAAKHANAVRHGAAAVLIAGEPNRRHRGRFDPPLLAADRQTARGNAPPQTFADGNRVPVLSISDSLRDKLLAAGGRTAAQLQESIDRDLRPQSVGLADTTIELRVANSQVERGVSSNVAGLLEGADARLKGETILITAHYDHLGARNGRVYPGANDNASGTAAVIELARAFAAARVKPKRSILFVVFGSEEEGLLGSYYYADHPLRPLATTRAVLNLDMIGRDEAHTPETEGLLEIPRDTANEINLVGSFYSPELRSLIRQEGEKVGLKISTKFDQDHALNVLFRCDHFPFLLRDVPAVWFFGGFHPGYHEFSDTVEKINFAKVEKVTRLAYTTARALADARRLPKFVAATCARPPCADRPQSR